MSENGVRYGVDVVQGHKTGFYLDQRDNRAAVARYVAGKRVLDVFCYTGGFGLTALKVGKASEVHAVDVSEAALGLAKANAELNQVSCAIRFEKSDAFEALERLAADGESFDTVILDPPKLTRHRAGLAKALRGYHSLNQLALGVLAPGGILVSCSCSGLIGRDDFVAMLGSRFPEKRPANSDSRIAGPGRRSSHVGPLPGDRVPQVLHLPSRVNEG